MEPTFGWIPPSPERRLRNNLYRLSTLGLEAPPPGSVEVTFNHHPEWDNFYTQQNNGCTGFSWSRMMSIYNNKRYDANWLYCEATKRDGDPGTSCTKDTGGYVWACGKVAVEVGMKLYDGGQISLPDGVESYYWCENINDIRTAFSIGRPVVLGTLWYQGFMNPDVDAEGRRWFPTDHKKWGGVLGGHAYCQFAWSDRLDGMCLTNSWGREYPPTWIKSQTILELLQGDGECCVAVDRGAVPPPPPPVDEDTIKMKTTYKNRKYSGVLKVK